MRLVPKFLSMVLRFILTILALSLTPLPSSAQEQIPQNREEITLSFAPIVKKVAPAVVNIYAKRKVTVHYRSPFFNDPFFSMFMDDRIFGGRMREHVENSLGSGVIINKDGLVITNAHVIRNAEEITVGLSDGREFEASLQLQDDASDLAVLKIKEAHDLPTVTLKPSETLEVGDLVLAIGNPFGVGQTVTSGIVSAQGRSSLDINDFNFFIQTDAAINPGNSGGALVALDGGIVGINTAIYSRDGGSLGIGFAIPSEMVNAVIAAAQQGQTGTGGIARPWLGVTAQILTADIAETLGLDKPQGVLIADLHPASPLKKAGLKSGDLITGMNGKTVRSPAEMKFRMAGIAINQNATLQVTRQGKAMTFAIKAIAPPEEPPRNTVKIDGNNPLSGASLSNINPAIAGELGIDDRQSGVVISAVQPASPASRIAAAGALLKSVNGAEIKTVADAAKALANKSENGWDITLNIGGRNQRIIIR